MSHKRLVFHEKKFFQEVIHPQIFFVIYLYLDASAKRIFKQKNSLADLMHSHISKSDHSGVDIVSQSRQGFKLSTTLFVSTKMSLCLKKQAELVNCKMLWGRETYDIITYFVLKRKKC